MFGPTEKRSGAGWWQKDGIANWRHMINSNALQGVRPGRASGLMSVQWQKITHALVARQFPVPPTDTRRLSQGSTSNATRERSSRRRCLDSANLVAWNRPEMELGHILWPSDPVTRESSDPETQLTRWPCSIMNSRKSTYVWRSILRPKNF